VLRVLPGAQVVEMKRCRNNSFCCGAGGGRAWAEEEPSQRINHRRAEQALETGADTVAVGCPFCMMMFEDGVKARAGERPVVVKDIAELVEEATRES
ncbi:MAG: (Fe-S)-binding protein, partial [Clostridia bacterium]|nr:(Fe-S)-binding protein [Clostridia bacterium]